MICNKCKRDIPDDSGFCQYCGNTIQKNSTAPKKQKSSTGWGTRIIVIALFVILIAALVYTIYSKNLQSASDNATEKTYVEKVIIASRSNRLIQDDVEEVNKYLLSGWTVKSVITETVDNYVTAIFVLKKD